MEGAANQHPAEVLLLDYMIGELGPDSSDAVRRHINGCRECRGRVSSLSLAMDEIDRLPSAAIPHDVLQQSTLTSGRRARRRLVRVLPVAILLAAAIGVLALFESGGLRAPTPAVGQQVVVRTASDDPAGVVAALLSVIPHRIVVDADDERHLVVLVSGADVDLALNRLRQDDSPTGRTYVVDVAGTGYAAEPTP